MARWMNWLASLAAYGFCISTESVGSYVISIYVVLFTQKSYLYLYCSILGRFAFSLDQLEMMIGLPPLWCATTDERRTRIEHAIIGISLYIILKFKHLNIYYIFRRIQSQLSSRVDWSLEAVTSAHCSLTSKMIRTVHLFI